MNDCSGREYHEATKHSWASVRQNAYHLDWSTQPRPMKFYPDALPRTPLEKTHPSHLFIYRIGGINAKKSYPGVEYYLRTSPSAGALYPNELYFQARGVEGFEDGIYHFEVGRTSAVMLQPIGAEEGLEPFLRLRRPMRGLLFFISAVYWRSSWKYRDRAYRYCLLDGGHLLGGIEAGSHLYRHAYRIAYGIDLAELNAFFGFGREEFFLSAAIAAVPESDRTVQMPVSQIGQVDPTGTFEPNIVIERAYAESMALHGCRPNPRFPTFHFHEEAWEEAIMKRRSIREFSGRPILKAHYEKLLETIRLPIPSDCDEEVSVYAVVNRVDGMKQGLYRGDECLKEGDFSQKAGYLCLEQRLGSDSGVTFFLTSGGCNYRPLCQKAGILGHRIYLTATYLGLGCSGIGAYYDDDVRRFLGDDGMVLYALAVGA
ncbi:SagB/ThcOx family dehydrogenase [Hydrogenimonas sp. SS33]|uniref:SagB/ThcOx family dehydrogenase n=1 Tax=Hydrogenimonas leucolamina TaxID=2954236 RepID=UPI00336BEC56